MRSILSVFCLFFFFYYCFAFPTGPGACGGPNGFVSIDGIRSPHNVSLANPNYWMVTGVPTKYTLGQTYMITINGTNAPPTIDGNGCALNQIAGFLMVAKDANGVGQGTWATTNYTQVIHCGTTVQQGLYTASTNLVDPLHVNFTFTGVAVGHTLLFNTYLAPTTFTVAWTAPTVGAGNLNFTGIALVDPQSSFILVPTISTGPPPPTTPSASTAGTAGGNNLAATTTAPLTVGQLAGIVIGSILGFVLLALLITPIVFALTHKSDPRVQRWTQRMTGGFDRRNGV
jgi:hypothetical protein